LCHSLPAVRPLRRPRTSSVFPYTTLFRSEVLPDGSFQALLSPPEKVEKFTPPLAPNITNSWAVIVVNPNNAIATNKIDFFIFLRSEEHTSELQSRENLVCRLRLEKKTRSS